MNNTNPFEYKIIEQQEREAQEAIRKEREKLLLAAKKEAYDKLSPMVEPLLEKLMTSVFHKSYYVYTSLFSWGITRPTYHEDDYYIPEVKIILHFNNDNQPSYFEVVRDYGNSRYDGTWLQLFLLPYLIARYMFGFNDEVGRYKRRFTNDVSERSLTNALVSLFPVGEKAE